MGCDIHAYKEIKVNGQWHFAGPAPIKRRYGVFGLMTAGKVRGDDDGLGFAPKGLPDDVTEPVRKSSERWDSDGHTHSYLTSQELAKLREKFVEWATIRPEPGMEKFQEKPDWFISDFGDIDRFHPLLEFRKYDQDLDDYGPEWVEDVRLVFWFDN